MITRADVEAARPIVMEAAVRTPLLPLGDVHVKLENLQPIGSFKIRGATHAVRRLSPEKLAKGVMSASAGNMAQGVAWAARHAGVPATIIVPDHAAKTKLEAIERLGAKYIKVSRDRWWRVIVEHAFEDLDMTFVHPVENDDVMAGNGTIGLEILEDLPEVENILVPWGGGGLSCGISAAVRGKAKVYAVEVENATPLTASRKAGKPVEVDVQPCFVDGMGGRSVLARMWELSKEFIDGTIVVTLDEVWEAIRTLAFKARVVAEGAGAASLAAAGKIKGKTACVISGGNIDTDVLVEILK